MPRDRRLLQHRLSWQLADQPLEGIGLHGLHVVHIEARDSRPSSIERGEHPIDLLRVNPRRPYGAFYEIAPC